MRVANQGAESTVSSTERPQPVWPRRPGAIARWGGGLALLLGLAGMGATSSLLCENALAAGGSSPKTDVTTNKLDPKRPLVVEPPDAGLIPYRTLMDESISLYEQKRYHKASTALFDYLEKPIPAVLSAEARYRLGRSLEVLNMPVLAMGMYRDITRFGPIVGKVYTEALNAWVLLSLKYDDQVELYNRIQHLPVASDPTGLPVLAYLRGLAKIEHGQLEDGLKLLLNVATPDTVVGRQAAYTAAVTLAHANKRAQARKLLEPLQTGTPKPSLDIMSARELQIVDRLKEQASLALARIAYQERRFADARGFYAKLNSHSVYQPRVQYELAWISFFEDKGLEVLPQLARLRLDRQMEVQTPNPPPAEKAMSGGGVSIVPESELLAALFYLRSNQHDLADGVLRSYLERLHVVRLALRDLDRSYESDPDPLWLARVVMGIKPEIPLEGEGDDGARDPSLVALAERSVPPLRNMVDEACRDRDITRSLARIEVLRQEFQTWNKQLSWWKGSALGQYAAKTLAMEERKSIELIGQVLDAYFLRQRLSLSEQNVMGLALRREVTTQRLAGAASKTDPDPYTGEPLPPFDFVRPEP